MKKLEKQFIVVYDSEEKIVSKSVNNLETIIGEGKLFAEFDSEEELNQFIENNNLYEDELAV